MNVRRENFEFIREIMHPRQLNRVLIIRPLSRNEMTLAGKLGFRFARVRARLSSVISFNYSSRRTVELLERIVKIELYLNRSSTSARISRRINRRLFNETTRERLTQVYTRSHSLPLR